MFAVVGCGECGELWVVSGRPETTGCPRCGTRHRFERLKRFIETDDRDRARQARSTLIARRSGHADAIDELGDFEDLADEAAAGGVSDEDYLGAAGIDVEAVETAGERARNGRSHRPTSRHQVIRAALRELDEPTETSVVAFATDRGVPADETRRLLARLLRTGEAIEDDGRYRLL